MHDIMLYLSVHGSTAAWCQKLFQAPSYWGAGQELGGMEAALMVLVVCPKDPHIKAKILKRSGDLLSHEEPGELGSRVAAVKWLLLTMPSVPAHSDAAKLCQLTEEGRSDLLMRVASMLISLDGIDVLNSQHEIRRFLLETDIPLQRLLQKPAKVGRAVVSLLFCPDHAEQVKRRELGVALASSFEEILGYDILTWELKSGGEAHRLTPAAHAALLEYAPNLDVVEVLLRNPLLSAISKLLSLEGAQCAEGFLCEVLENLQNSDTLVLTILKLLSSKEEEIAKVMTPLSTKLRAVNSSLFSSSRNPFLPALYSALQSESLGNYLAMVAHGSQAGRPLQLSLDSCTMLQDLYIQYFRQATEMTTSGIDSTYAIHQAMLDHASCASLFTKLSEMKDPNPKDLALLWYCWRQSPDRQLPFWALPSSQLGPLFVFALNTGLPFVERCKPMRFGLSVLAKFLVAPETLPLGVYNTLAEKAPWVHTGSTSASIQVQTLLLGQEDQEEYPPYCIRWHARAVPPPLRHQLLRRCHRSVVPVLDTAAHDFYPRLNSGISEANLRFNLGLMLALRSNNPDLQVYFDHGADHQRQFVAGCILSWFKAAGISYHDLLECVRPEDQADFTSLWEEVHEAYRRTGPASLRRMYVRGPLPTDIDVRWIDEGARDVPILARTRDSAVLTAQWLNMLLLHFKLSSPEPFEAEDLVVETASGLQVGKRLDSALATISEAVGSALRRDLSAKESALVIALADGKFDTLQLVTRVSVLADFVLLLRTSTMAAETPMKIGHFFEQLIRAFAHQQGPEPPDAHIAALFDAFFLLHGLTSENEGLEVEALAKAYQAYNLPVSAQTMEEVRWLHENYYGRKEKTSGIKCRLPRFATVCDRIATIQRLELRKVTFQRHLEKTQFVGELFAKDFDVNPPYLLQSNMQLLCSLPLTVHREDLGEQDEAVHEVQEAISFFCEVGSDQAATSAARSYGGFNGGQWEWPDLGADWKEPCPVISAANVVEIVSESEAESILGAH
ncbi:ANK_REP_REGION domain-containing protein [Durusdinium trenchii]|uniref:ANK_REP_REGION domain-containing protein n=1 Tax=Durusdinium trenchii TaxID=1381693 RepID=A0ABP0Q1L5_9DINO